MSIYAAMFVAFNRSKIKNEATSKKTAVFMHTAHMHTYDMSGHGYT